MKFRNTLLSATIGIAAVPYLVNLVARWEPLTNEIVSGYILNVNDRAYRIPGRTNSTLTISNQVAPAGFNATIQTYTSAGAVSQESDPSVVVLPVRTLQLSAPTNYVVQRSTDFKSWISTPAVVTNNGSRCFFRATTNWP